MGHRGVAAFGSLPGASKRKQSVCVHIRNSESRNLRLSALKIIRNSEPQKSQSLRLSQLQTLTLADCPDLLSDAQTLTLAELLNLLALRSFTHLAVTLYS